MKRCITFLLIVFTLFLVACTSVQETPKEDALSQARARVGSWNCETGESGLEWDIAPSKDECYFHKAILFENKSFCEKMDDPENFGFGSCVEALKNCNELTSTQEKDECYSQKNSLRWNTASMFNLESEYLTSYCDKITDQVGKDVCFLQTAGVTKDLSVCEKISGENGVPYVGPITPSLCYSQIAIGDVDFAICEKIIPGELTLGLQESCWYNIMLTKIACITQKEASGVYCPFNSYEAAEGINEYDKQAVATQDESKCASIKTTLSQEGCFGIIAIKKGDKTVCDNIQTPALKDQCKNFVESFYI